MMRLQKLLTRNTPTSWTLELGNLQCGLAAGDDDTGFGRGKYLTRCTPPGNNPATPKLDNFAIEITVSTWKRIKCTQATFDHGRGLIPIDACFVLIDFARVGHAHLGLRRGMQL